MNVVSKLRHSLNFAVLPTLVFLVSIVLSAALKDGAMASGSVPQSEKRFQRDLQSLLGVSVSTRNGDFFLRQQKDVSGRIRKQILVGADFSEIQLDQDGDGTVDYWSVKRGLKSAAASHPSQGRFLRLVVTDRIKEGTHEATYLLDRSGKSYRLLKNRFLGRAVTLRSEGESDGSSSTDGFVPVAAAELDASFVPSDRIELSETSMMEHQATILGPDFLCESPDSVQGRVAVLQRDWWKILKVETDRKQDRLNSYLKASRLFDSSCRKPGREKDFDSLVDGLSKVMMSSSKGEALDVDRSQTRYLRCLEKSGLGVTAAEMEQHFMDAANGLNGASISCPWNKGAGALTVPAEVDVKRNQIMVYMTEADRKKAEQNGSKNRDGSPTNFSNVLFHEFIHVAGIHDEDITHAAQGCCGDGTTDRAKACEKLDRLVAKEKRIIELETHLQRTALDRPPMAGVFEEKFGDSDTANKLYREFLSGLDEYGYEQKSNGEFRTGLVSDKEFQRCVAYSTESSEARESACREKWASHLRAYADQFFGKKCRQVVPGAQRKVCKEFDDQFKTELANSIAGSMINKPAGCISGSTAVRSEAPADPYAESRSSLSTLFDFIFGTRAFANGGGEDCRDSISVPSVVNIGQPGVKRIVPGDSDIDNVAGVGSRPDVPSSGSSSEPRIRPPSSEASPLPVTRADSVESGGTFVEDRYRRATDFVGQAGRGVASARELFLPAASAATTSTSRSSSAAVGSKRLGPKDSFVAFRPEKAKDLNIKIDNPFAARRGLASILPGAAPVDKKTESDKNIAAPVATGSKVVSISPGKTGGASIVQSNSNSIEEKPTAPRKSAVSSPLSGGVPVATGASAAVKKQSAVATTDALSGLFTSRYREIEDRLKSLDVVEALVSKKIAIQDASGKQIGSKKPVERYQFVGFEQPLSKQAERSKASE